MDSVTPASSPAHAVRRALRVGLRAHASTPRILAGLLATAVLLRLGSALYQGNTVAEFPGVYDQISYHGLAERVVGGHGFSFAEGHWPATAPGAPTAHWSYLYTLYLAAIYALVGVEPLVARLLQAVLTGLLHPWLAWRVGRRLFGDEAGLVAAGISAIYVYFFYYAGGLLTESFYFVGILWTFDVAMRLVDDAARRAETPAGRAPDTTIAWRLWIELGLALGVTGLLRQVFLVWSPGLYLWLWWHLRAGRCGKVVARRWQAFVPSRAALAGAAVATLTVALLILPWTVRNYRAFGSLTPLNTNAGFALFWGNHPIHGTSFMPLLPVGGPSYGDLIPERLRALNEADLDRALLREALAIIAADPVRYVRLSITRIEEYFKFWPSRDSGLLSNVSRVASFGLFLPFIIHGLGLAVRRRRDDDRGGHPGIVLLWLFAAGYTVLHLMTWTLVRYRLPVDAVLIPFAAVSLCQLRQMLGARSVRQPFTRPAGA